MLELKPDRAALRDLQAPRASSLRGHEPSGVSTEAERVYEAIFDAVMDRRLPPGARLTEAALCTAFRCSRSTVRAALARLAHDRIVTIEANRGARVWQATPDEVRDVFAARRLLEDAALERLAARADIAQCLVPLRDMVDRERLAFERGDRISWIRLSNAFHVELVRVLGNQVLVDMLSGLCARTTLIIALFDTAAASTCSYVEHGEILDHLARRDARAARERMDHHLLDCEQRMAQPGTPPADPWAAFGVRL